MKKLIIAASLISAAALTHAAVITWGADAFYIPADANGTYSTTDKTAKGKVTGYLWETDATTFAKFFGESATLDVYTEFAKTDHGALGATTIDPAASGVSRNVSMTGTTDWGEGSTAYGIVLYTYNDGSKDWYVSNGATYDVGKVEGSVEKLNLYESGFVAGVAQGDAITGWTAVGGAVPEPTSGLLLLLGVAGLALRRRRA